MNIRPDFANGIKFYGTDGRIFVSRGKVQVTKSDPAAKLKALDSAGRDGQRDHSVSDRAG
jgi:hypothetical protein